MKKIINIYLFFLLLILFPINVIKADIIPPDTHPVKGCSKIVNIDEYPNIYIIAFEKGFFADDSNQIKILSSDYCLKFGKYVDTDLFWSSKKYVDTIGLNNIQFIIPENQWHDASVITPGIFSIEGDFDFANDGYIDNNNPATSINEQYSIAGFDSNENLVLYLSSRISSYDNGNSDLIENFPAPNIAGLHSDPNIDFNSFLPNSDPTPTSTVTTQAGQKLISTGPSYILILLILVIILIGYFYYLYKSKHKEIKKNLGK